MASTLLAEAKLISASALIHFPSMTRRNHDFNELMERSSLHYESDLERRSPQGTSNTGDLSLSAPDVESNSTTLAACTTGLQQLTNVTNEAGFAACYNILDWHENMGGMFQADLRLFQFSTAVGQFANVSTDSINVQLNYPNSTQYSVLMNSRRIKRSIQERQNSPTEIQQYSLVGNFKIQMDLKKLNTTEIMSLLIPQITLHVPSSNGNVISSDLPASDTVYFVAGQFTKEATPELAAKAANPLMAQKAIADAQGFVLPGTTFGIFPVGLIVTGSWTALFFLAFGLGTLGRIRHRDVYRKRIAATGGRAGRK